MTSYLCIFVLENSLSRFSFRRVARKTSFSERFAWEKIAISTLSVLFNLGDSTLRRVGECLGREVRQNGRGVGEAYRAL